MRHHQPGSRVRLHSASQLPALPSFGSRSGVPRLCRKQFVRAGCIVGILVFFLINGIVLVRKSDFNADSLFSKLPTTNRETPLHIGQVVYLKEKAEIDINAYASKSESRNLLNLKPDISSVRSPHPHDNTEHPTDGIAEVKAPGPSESALLNAKTTPNEVLQKSAIVPINIQSDCHIEKIIEEFSHDYPDIALYLEINSHTEALCLSHLPSTVHCVNTGDQCTHGCAYNNIVSTINSYGIQYIFVWDVRYSYKDIHLLALLAKRYVDSKATIVSPCIHGVCNYTTGMLFHSKRKQEVTALPTIFPTTEGEISVHSACQLTNTLPPVFLTKASTLARYTWDRSLTEGLHTDFLLTLKKRRVRAAVCTDIQVVFKPLCDEQKATRSEEAFTSQWLSAPASLFIKWNLSTIYNGYGRACHLKDKALIECQNAEWKSAVANEKLNKYLQKTVIQYENNLLPGWMNYRLRTDAPQNLRYMETSECMLRIQGSLSIEFERHKSFSNKNSTLDVDMYHFNRSCDMLHYYWNLGQYGKLKRRQVYYVTAVSNDTEYMSRLLNLVNLQTDRQFTNLVIVDMSRPGKEQFDLSKYKVNIPAYYIHLGAPFSRSIGLKRGFEFAQMIAQNKTNEEPILFAIDTSMVIPKDFTRRIWRNTRCSVSSYAPICYKEKGDEGFWVQYGYGMIGVCASDYNKSGGWDQRWGYHWGAEDVDLTHRIQDVLPYIVRVKENSYKHSHTDASRIYSKLYYKNKNMYPKQLPVTPHTRQVMDASLKTALADYAIKEMKYPIQLSPLEVYETSLPGNKGVLYDIRLINDINEEYYALINSV